MNATSMAAPMEKPDNVVLSQKSQRDDIDLEDDQVGPVFVKLTGQIGWMKVNNFSACDQCRTSHVKCSLSVTGGPCNHCKNRNQVCKVHGWIFNPESPADHIYKPVLPPPPVAPSSPSAWSQTVAYQFEWELLVQKLTWLQREAPRKFRKRSTAMPWKDEPSIDETSDNSRKRCTDQQVGGATTFEKITAVGQTKRHTSVSGGLAKRRRIVKEAKAPIFECLPPSEQKVAPSTQHRMSISFMLSPCNSEQMVKPEERNDGSAMSSNGRDSRRASFTSSEGSWSTRSDTRSPSLSLPEPDSLPKSTNPNNIPARSPPVPHQIEKKEILSKFKQWRPPFDSSVILSENCTFPPIRRF
ncbi:hypothetical protein PTTG_11782 [Puccinia triticina 1-1 BBBD Race 1]|uniref:Zn(2)-C6 fungal-type domain-containing protein n=1 Tax=Puccinia triticina (isolate 1-1 / race 1 (BBBD)) TaxID=630390 RepID=A0A180GFP6_PUCT1|nr:hypothetical protein PTTG_11782 [Puccinia triticina 1-1 BBBD Race 1]WAR54282.1 hypothetical protein PtB15_3B796 [Puccinia triticina]